MQDDYQQSQYPHSVSSSGGPSPQGYPGFMPGGWQQMPPQQPTPPKKKHRALKIIGGGVGALVLLGIIISATNGGGSGSAPTTATQPDKVPSAGQAKQVGQANQPSQANQPAPKADAACQLLPTIESQVKAGNYDVAQRDAQHAESLASKEGSLSSFDETADFATLAMDLINVDGIDKATVNADLATVTDDCK